MESTESTQEKTDIYKIDVEGILQDSWAAWIDGGQVDAITPEPEANQTSIRVQVPDQAALRGVLNKIWDLNLIVVLVQRKQNALEPQDLP